VLAGAGDKALCAGADLKGVGDRGTTLEARESFGGLARIPDFVTRMRKPLIAQVHGYALAGGCGLAAGCDVVIAADDAVFGLPEIKIGRLPLMVMAPILPSVGRKRGLLMILSGESITAREAFEMGLVSRVVPRADTTTRPCRQVAQSPASGPSTPARASRRTRRCLPGRRRRGRPA